MIAFWGKSAFRAGSGFFVTQFPGVDCILYQHAPPDTGRHYDGTWLERSASWVGGTDSLVVSDGQDLFQVDLKHRAWSTLGRGNRASVDPTGRYIAYGNDQGRLALAVLSGGILVPLWTDTRTMQFSPRWSFDSRYVVFTATERNLILPNARVVVRELATGREAAFKKVLGKNPAESVDGVYDFVQLKQHQ